MSPNDPVTGLPKSSGPSLVDRFIAFAIRRKFAVALLMAMVVLGGLVTAPFDWEIPGVFRSPVAVDAIPDIGENQQIVYTEWTGRSPQDVEDQVTYPLTISLLGVPEVKTIRSSSAFGFSSIYVIFKDGVDFYWARSRILEKLSSLPDDSLPEGVEPRLGPDATALGQIFWYTLEGLDPEGRFVGGFDPQELRTVQDWYVRYGLLSAEGVAEVASVGGFVREYQVDVDPLLLEAYGVTLQDAIQSVTRANIDVGARTMEINKVEYLIRGLGFIRGLDDLRNAVIATRDNIPIFLNQVANVSYGPALRLGALDKNGREVVGGVVTVRYGENPMAVIKNVKEKIAEIAPGLPRRTLADGTESRVSIVPFYDRSGLIAETLQTLDSALISEVLVAAVVVLTMVVNFASALIVTAVLPLAVLLVFIAMRVLGVDANIVALAGIAIAIGTMVDMGIIMTENILRRLGEAPEGVPRARVVYEACREVGGALVTAISTTIVSFLPVFTLAGSEGKLFRPLAYTKTFALFASLVVALAVVPAASSLLFGKSRRRAEAGSRRTLFFEVCIYLGAAVAFFLNFWVGLLVAGVGILRVAARYLPERAGPLSRAANFCAVLAVVVVLAGHWQPLGPARGGLANLAFVVLVLGVWLAFFSLFIRRYERILSWALANKKKFLAVPAFLVFLGAMVWLGFPAFFGWMPQFMTESAPARFLARNFPGLSSEFMPPLDEGSFLFMPSTMPHASISEALAIVRQQDTAIESIPEVSLAVGKIGRADSPLDPAPVSMIETVINYYPQFILDDGGIPRLFACDMDEKELFRDEKGLPVAAPDGAAYFVRGKFARDERGGLVPDEEGKPFSLWRPALDPSLNPGRNPWPGIRNPDDIWDEVVRVTRMPGTTVAPLLQPISARLVMLQSGIRASMGVAVKGPNLASIQKASDNIERFLREVDSIRPASVVADRIVAKPYVEIDVDRQAAAQYGLDLQDVQDVIETAVGGKIVTTTVEGRERYPVRVRYMRELRDEFQTLGNILVTSPDGVQVPLSQVAEIRYAPGPSVIKTDDSFLTGYVLFDAKRGRSEMATVRDAGRYLATMIDAGLLKLPPGVTYSFTGTFESHQRAQDRLRLILPLTMAVIFLILYLHFSSVRLASLVFAGVLVAWAGGFLMLWLYGVPWFMDFSLFGVNMRELFGMGGVALSLPVWVGFLALFGIATDDGVVMATYLNQSFSSRRPASRREVRQATLAAGLRRVRPCLMTTATTVIALIPVLTSSGRGADLVLPMAVPPFGGMVLAVITMLVVPVVYCALEERRLESGKAAGNKEGEPETQVFDQKE